MLNYAETEESIRAELTKEFPGIQFSIERFSPESKFFDTAVILTWFDGPTIGAVHAITYKFDGEKDCYVVLSRNYSWSFIELVVSQICAVLSVPMLKMYQIKNNAWMYAHVLKKSEQDHLYEIVHATDAKNQHRVYEALKDAEESEERERAEREAMKKVQAEREERERVEREAMEKAQTEREERERAEEKAEREREEKERIMVGKVKRSAVIMFEYGASRVWHTKYSDLFIDRNQDNTSWCIVKMNPTRIEFRTPDIEKLRDVAKREFCVDVDAEVWLP